jgi:hypothetical protein
MTGPDAIRTVTQARKRIPLNNNNRNNNRRRGRNNRGQGGGNQGNRIDSRARGNAPQMLEKYKKLAHDASLNGDRVQTEYYLQFADHYFRVIADNKTQRDDQPQRSRRDDRGEDDYGAEDDNEFETASRRERERNDYREAEANDEGRRGSEGDEVSPDEDDNPFVRESRPRRNEGRSNEGRDNRDSRARNGRANGANRAEEREEEGSAGLDPASLPPAIGAAEAIEEEAPRPRRRTRKPRGSDDEALEAVS